MNNRQKEDNTANRVARNTFALSVSKLIQVAHAIVFAALIARYLRVELFGLYSFITSLMSVFIPLSYFGMQRVVIREIAKNKEAAAEYLGAALILRALFSSLMVISVTITLQFLHLPHNAVVALYIFALSAIFMSFNDMFINTFIAFEKMVYVPIINIVYGLFGLIAIIVIIFYDLGFTCVFLALLPPSIISFLLSYFLTREKFVKPKIEINYPLWRDIFKESYPLFIVTLSTQAFLRVDVFVLKALRGLSEVSLFFAPYMIIIRLQLIPQTIAMALLPTLSRLAKTSRYSFEKHYEKFFRFLFILSLPIAMVTTVSAEKIIILLFGDSFREATISLQILIWAIVLTFLDALLMNVLISLNKQRVLSFIYLLVLLVNLSLDLILVPIYGYVGACIGSIAAYMVRTGLTYYYVSKYAYFLPLNKIVLKPAISVLIVSIFLYLMKDLNLFFVAFLGVFFYLVILLLLGDFSKDDIALFKRALNRA